METDGGRDRERVQVLVERDGGAAWEVLLGDGDRVRCETLDEARRVGYLRVAHAHPCELIVQDAYHRVLQRELIPGHSDAPISQPPPSR